MSATVSAPSPQETLDRETVTGPVHVPLGKRVVTDMRDYFPYPRQSFAIDHRLLSQHGYGDAAIARLDAGDTITYHDYALTGPGRGVLEFPDGTRYETQLEFLGGNRVCVDIIRQLPGAVR